ncbi:hypothetical protein [Riemerella anatipestifer]|uniref:Uncharacterized protein n=1 Tax=Riemerella anatipestifer TaxID=34085 RepID=A0AAP6HHT1_RIEAN|nr:hypothetical protein [Riemerella anatipestifer]AKQ39401.1 hypothetical protein AS87_03455 [Riemerella anatipestifer Yb2]MCU7539532.1 hypothetical protein [Riemerella anatipestifer]MCU7571524.1 hypothetical protein [Riemerella anatipestifer]MCW0518294.1 hypothetical protein [Riemerella anatipestifer]MDR7817077.1 hypothetical protein [Riemerella anatipestifer]
MKFKDELNRILLSNYGVVIQTGTEELLAFPERKEVYENDWAEENGGDYILDSPRFKDKEVTLKMGILANNDEDFWQKYNAFFNEVTKAGFQTLYISDHSKSYAVFYKKTTNFKKFLKRLRNVQKVFVKFDLVLKVAFSYEAHFNDEYTKMDDVYVHRNYHKEDSDNKNKVIAASKRISVKESVYLIEKSPILLRNGIFQSSIDGYIGGKRAVFVCLNALTDNAIRRHLDKARRKRVDILVFIFSNNDEGIWRQKVSEAINRCLPYFTPKVRIIMCAGDWIKDY